MRIPSPSAARRPSSVVDDHDRRRAAMARTVVRDSAWIAAGVIILLVLTLTVLHFQRDQDPAKQLAFKVQRIELVDRMRLALASASEAEKSAVLAITDETSQTFADQARASTNVVEQAHQELAPLLETNGTDHERDLLGQFSQAFAELRRIDDDVLSLAVKNTNLKAYGLAYGPAADALRDMHDALSRLVAADGESHESATVMRLAFGAEIAALRVQTMLPPHIAEERDEKMDGMEASMRDDEEEARRSLDGLRAVPELYGNTDLRTATSSWERFREIKTQILALSRENTNVRSLTMSLNRKRNAMLAAQEVLVSLRQAIDSEPIAGITYGRPAKPR
jgi:hypothetical protein